MEGYYCRDCGIFTHKSNSHYVAGWAKLGYCPALHLENVKTPTLFLHGEVDFTCPVTQAEEMFRATVEGGT